MEKSHEHKGPISMKNIDLNKIVVSNKVWFGKKKVLNISLATKMLKKLILHVHSSPKRVDIGKTLMKLNIYLSLLFLWVLRDSISCKFIS